MDRWLRDQPKPVSIRVNLTAQWVVGCPHHSSVKARVNHTPRIQSKTGYERHATLFRSLPSCSLNQLLTDRNGEAGGSGGGSFPGRSLGLWNRSRNRPKLGRFLQSRPSSFAAAISLFGAHWAFWVLLLRAQSEYYFSTKLPFSYLIVKFVIKWQKPRCSKFVVSLFFFFCRFKRKMATYWVFNACRLEVEIWEPSWVLRCCFSMDSSWWSLNFHHYTLTNAK